MKEDLDRIQWITDLIIRLFRERFTGELILNFHEGNPSRKFSKRTTETAMT